MTTPLSQVNAAGDVVSLQLSATDAPGNTLTYGETGLPDGLSIDPTLGVISGTVRNDAARATPYDVTVTAGDGSQTASQNFEWVVNTVGVSNPGNQGNMAGDVVSLPITGVNASGLALAYSESGLPQGLTINPVSGEIGGTIALTAGSSQPYAVTVTATDGQHSGGTSFAWDVAPPTLPDRTDVEGATVSFQTPEPYPDDSPSYSATDLPNGVSIDPNTGVISGAIADGDSAAGPYAVTVTTTYEGGESSTSQTFNWTIQPAVNGVPTLATVADSGSNSANSSKPLVTNDIFADNVVQNDPSYGPDVFGTVASASYNLVSETDGSAGWNYGPGPNVIRVPSR